MESLLKAKVSKWGALNGVNEYFFGNGEEKIFLPAVGFRTFSSELYRVDSTGLYWSNKVYGSLAYALVFNDTYIQVVQAYRAGGLSVRCVKD